MPSNTPTFPVELDNGDGTTTRIASTACKVSAPPYSSDLATVTTNSDGIFPTTAVSPAAGTLLRIRVENYQGRAGYVEVVTV